MCHVDSLQQINNELYLSTEACAEFTIHLEDKEGEEEESVTFNCELSKPDKPVTWMKDGRVLENGDKYQITSDGCEHSMTIQEAELDDATEYTVTCGDHESKASLYVKGELHQRPCSLYSLAHNYPHRDIGSDQALT